MEPNKKVLILDQVKISHKLIRIAYQILEDNFEEKEIVLVGVAPHGYIIAERLSDYLLDISKSEKNITLMKVTVDKEKSSLDASTDIPVSDVENKTIVLVDDVLSSGRTLAYAMGVFFDIPLKKMRTAVLIDRSHHRFPVYSDYYGMKLSTTLKEHVTVSLRAKDGSGKVQEDAAWLS
ncbi:MAG TPA: phosphoribosyltransferase family protein [Sphingobacteriaceae bacterium]|nr:phosphoribosyltransferase family protein [Sphingobacteriaceae bacterium]